jgi:hypothetical protein
MAEYDVFQTTVHSPLRTSNQTSILGPSAITLDSISRMDQQLQTPAVISAERKKRFIGAQRELLDAADVRDDNMIRISDLQQTLDYQILFESDALNKFITIFVMISLFWAILNLAPVYPLDGGQITRELLVLFNVNNAIPKSLFVSIATGVAIGIWGLNNNSMFLTLMFFLMAYSSYQLLQRYQRGF